MHVLFCACTALLALWGCLEMSSVKEKARGCVYAGLERRERGKTGFRFIPSFDSAENVSVPLKISQMWYFLLKFGEGILISSCDLWLLLLLLVLFSHAVGSWETLMCFGRRPDKPLLNLFS